jgi:hypothetical protein
MIVIHGPLARCDAPYCGSHAPRARTGGKAKPIRSQHDRSTTALLQRTGDRGSRTLLSYYRLSRTDTESARGDSSRSQAARERPSDTKVSDNRHGQRWTSADTRGRSIAAHACYGAGSPRLYLASGRRGHVQHENAVFVRVSHRMLGTDHA